MAFQNSDKVETGSLSLFAITWPLFLELAMHSVTLSLNLFLVGQINVDLVAALTVGNQVFTLCMIVFNFTGIGTTVVIARSLGARRFDDIPKVFHMGMAINIIMGLLITTFIFLFNESIMSVMNMPEALLADGHAYFLVISLALLPEAINFVFISILRAYGFTKNAMYVSVAVNMVTFVGNILLLFGFWGIPQYGVAGVAFSTFVGRIFGLICLFLVVKYKTNITVHLKQLFVWYKNLLVKMMGVGLPGAGEHMAWHLQFMLLTSFVALFGKIPLATHGLYFQICLFIMLFAESIAMGTEIIIAHHVGAFKLKSAYQQLMRSLTVGFIITTLVALSNAFIFGKPLLSLFTDSKEVMIMATPLFLLSIIMEPGRIFNIIIINSLRATGDAQFPLIMALVSMWGISVPLAYFLGVYLEMGLIGVWIAMCTDEWVRGISMFIRWRTRIWERKVIQSKKQELSFKFNSVK